MGSFGKCACVWVFSDLNTSHIVSSKYSGVNHFLSLFLSFFFFMSARSDLPKSSGRTRRQRAGGLRRVSRSGCWQGWPWWPGSWWVHSSPRNACEGRYTTTLPTLFLHDPLHLPPSQLSPYTPQKLKWRSCLSRQNCWWCLLFSPPSQIPQWTKNPHMLLNFWEKDREEKELLVFTCSPYSSPMVVQRQTRYLSFTEPIVPSIPFSTGSCMLFLSLCLYVLVLTNFVFPFSSSKEAKLIPVFTVNPSLSDISVLWGLGCSTCLVLKLVLLLVPTDSSTIALYVPYGEWKQGRM